MTEEKRAERYVRAVSSGVTCCDRDQCMVDAAVAVIAVADAEQAELRETIDGLKLAVKILGEMTTVARGKELAAQVELNLRGGQ